MSNQLFKGWETKLEAVSLCVLFLYFIGTSPPSIIGKLLRLGSYGILALLIIWRWRRFAYAVTRDIPLLLLVGIAAFSVVWSVAPGETTSSARGLIRTTMLGVYLASRYSIKEQMRLWLWVYGIAALLSLVAALILPSGIDASGLWKGIFPSKNFMARSMSIAAILSLNIAFLSQRKKWFALSVSGLAVVLLVLTQGKTALILLFLLLALLPFYKFIRQYYKVQVIIYSTVLLLVGCMAILILGNLETILVDILGKNMDLNGRIPIWELCMDKVLERPWIGYGYAAFFKSDEALYVLLNSWANNNARSFYAHNGYIGMLLGLGFLGLSLLIFNLITTLYRLVKLLNLTKTIETIWMLQIIVFLLTYNMFDGAGLLASSDALWTMYVSISISSALQYKAIRKKRYSMKALNRI